MRHILVVDDDPDIRTLIAAALEAEGYSVVTTSNGEEALDRIATNQPRLALLDLQMPLLTGWEVLAALREAGSALPVVFMSAGARARAEATRQQVAGYLPKPFALDALFTFAERFAESASPTH